MKKTDLAYLAGMLDGEGCIQIHKSKRLKKDGNPSYTLSVRVNMCDKPIPLFLQFVFGGALNYVDKSRYGDKWRPQWHWYVSGQQAIECLKALLPYLRLKKAEAELAFYFWENKRHKVGYQVKSPEVSVLEEANYILMKKLKRRSYPKEEVHEAVSKRQQRP